MQIAQQLLEKTCKNAIETILLCLKHATKGTIYRIGPMPELQAVRITSGIRNLENSEISWGLPLASDYNPPGKSWQQYRDDQGRVLEAMGWCVEQQKSWTADDPAENIRSVRKQLRGEAEDCHHMEPVLVRKNDLYGGRRVNLEYPLDWRGNPIWQDTDYVVVAVMKIHFLPQTIQQGDDATKVIKKISRAFGTELLSLHLRETYLTAQENLTRNHLEMCNAVAHELRNTLAKMGFIFSAINTTMSFLRAQWELELSRAFPSLMTKGEILEQLNKLLLQGKSRLNGHIALARICEELLREQEELANLFLLPQQEVDWLASKISPKWSRLLELSDAWKTEQAEVHALLENLEEAVNTVLDETLGQKMSHLPEDLRELWPRVAYTRFSVGNMASLDEAVSLLSRPDLCFGQKQQVKRLLVSLKVLVEIIGQLEEQSNRIISTLKAPQLLVSTSEVLRRQ
jgi:hypothetical protein